jgi:hypothetical protein
MTPCRVNIRSNHPPFLPVVSFGDVAVAGGRRDDAGEVLSIRMADDAEL